MLRPSDIARFKPLSGFYSCLFGCGAIESIVYEIIQMLASSGDIWRGFTAEELQPRVSEQESTISVTGDVVWFRILKERPYVPLICKRNRQFVLTAHCRLLLCERYRSFHAH